MRDVVAPQAHSDATVIRGAGSGESLQLEGVYVAECIGPDGKVKWRDTIKNLVTTVGKNDMLDKYLKGSNYTQTWRMGLAGAGSKTPSDTQGSHAGWSEVGGANAPTYTGDRKDVVMGTAAGGASSSPAQSFAITSSGTVAGCFINNGGSATKDNASGVLFSVGDFSGGSKTVANGDTINVTYSLTL